MASAQDVRTPAMPVLPTPGLPAAAPSRAAESGEHRFLIRDIDWAAYRKISEALDGRHFHMSFDGRDLELMTIFSEHGRCSRMMGQFVVVLTDENNQPRASVGDMTMDRQDLEKGIESDESFYIVNEPKIQGKTKIDLLVDPPPDLSVEIDWTTDSRRRFGIYAAIRVPEIWRYDGKVATIFRLQADGQYAIVENSVLFPFLTAANLVRFLELRHQMDEASLIRSFRAWVREQLGKGQP